MGAVIKIIGQLGMLLMELVKIDSRFNRFKHIGLFLSAFGTSAAGVATDNVYLMWGGFALGLLTHMRKAFAPPRKRAPKKAPAEGVPVVTPNSSEVVTKPTLPRPRP